MPALLLGIDLGTSGSKALILSADGDVVAQATHPYETIIPKPSWSEQDPKEWWASTRAAVRDVLQTNRVDASDVVGIGLTGQMHGLVCLDPKGDVIRPAILWNDQRTSDACKQIHDHVGRSEVVRHTGNPVLPGFTAPKLIWMRDHEPGLYDRIDQILLPKDYIRYRLTGTFATDVSDASGTSLFDVESRTWSDAMTQALQIPKSWLPPATESPEVSARLARGIADDLGLSPGLPVVGGAGDQAAGAVGTATVQEGTVSIAMGTSGVVFAPSEKYRADPNGRLHAFCHAVPDMWHLMGVMLSAAGSLAWYRDALFSTDGTGGEPPSYEMLIGEAESVPPGGDGVLFLPYLSGERTPHADPNARGVFFGLHLGHERGHMTRSVLEGVAFALRDSMALIDSLGLAADEVRVSGGGARSGLWRSILADVLGLKLTHMSVPDSAAVGAALLAGVGSGVYSNVIAATEKTYSEAGHALPGQNVERYNTLYKQFETLYPALRENFDAIASITNDRDAERT